jgi:putative oxidoreductase
MTVASSQRSLISTVLESDISPNPIVQIAWLVVRVTVGLLMIHNGLSKLANVQGFIDHVINVIGLPFPYLFTYLAAYTEIVASIFLVFGLLTRFSALALFFTMLVAVYFHIKDAGFQIAPLETASVYALCYLALVAGGGGTFSIDTLLAKAFDKK